MGKKSPSIPAPPDPAKTIAAQTQANKEALRESARINAVDIYSPYGSVTYDQDKHGIPTAQHTTLSEPWAQAFANQGDIASQLSDTARLRAEGVTTQDFSFDSLPYDPRNVNTASMPRMSDYYRTDLAPYNPAYQDIQFQAFDPNSVGPQAPQQANRGGDFQNYFGGYSTGGLPFGAEDQAWAMGQMQGFDASQFQAPEAQQLNKVYQGNLPYDPRTLNVSGFTSVDAGRAGDMPYAAAGQQANIAQYQDQRGDMPFDPRSYDSVGGYRDDVMDAFMARQRRNLEPVFDRQYERQQQDLANRGLPVTGDAYDEAMSNLNRNQENAWVDASNNAILQAGGEAERMLGMERGLRSDAFNEGLATNRQQIASEQARLGAEGDINQRAWDQYLGGTGAQNQAAQSILGAQMGIGDAAWDRRTTQNQMNNATAQAQFGMDMQASDADFNRALAGQGAQNQYAQNLLSGIQSARGGLTGEEYQQAQFGNQAYGDYLDAQSKLRSQAFGEGLQGTAAYNQAYGQQLQTQQAMRDATLNEWQRQGGFDQADWMTGLQTEQNLRSQMLQEMLTSRNQNINELSAMLQGSPAINTPAAPAPAQYRLQAPDVIGAYNANYNQQIQAANMQAQASAGMWSGIGQMGGSLAALAGKCARKYKEDDGAPERILDRMAKVPIRTWRYKREIEPAQPMHISPYAEDVHSTLGIGDGDSIPFIDMIGVCWRSIQELKEDVDKLKRPPRKRAPAKKRART